MLHNSAMTGSANAGAGPKIAVRYDLRSPEFGAGDATLYAAALEQASWADERGCFDWFLFNEHHGSEDGYCPSPLVLASGIASRTSRMRLLFSALILPLHHPLRLAEDIAVLDLVSGGRVDLVLAAGYREAEFAMFGRQTRQRPGLMRKGVEALRSAWTGDPFEFAGATVRVTPRPLQRPGPPLFLGGNSEAAARRAAQIGDGFFPGGRDPELQRAYREECANLGRTPRIEFISGPIFLHVALDPEDDWKHIAPHALHEANSYGRWMHEAGVRGPYAPISDAHALRSSGMYRVLTPQACIDLVASLDPDGTIVLSPLMAGLDPELGWRSLELFANEVAPKLAGHPIRAGRT